jgi:prephenate dehydrogenase
VAAETSGPPFRTIGIVGVGLVGGSIGLAARNRWPGIRVIGVDRKEVVREAIGLGAVTDRADAIATLAGESDLIILAAPIAQNLERFGELASIVAPATLVTDVGSTKRGIVAAADRAPHVSFVGGHPLGGAATSGVSAARDHLFRGRPWILTPSASHEPRGLERLERFVQGLGAVPSRLSAEAHDRLMAFVSHLPQVTASALLHTVGTAVGGSGLALSGPGLADTTRLASSPPGIWKDILAANADYVEEALDVLGRELDAVRRGLETPGRIPELFTSAMQWRGALRLVGENRRAGDSTTGAPPLTRPVPAVRTYLEMLEPPASRRALPDDCRLERADPCPPSFFRFLYREVGREWHWLDRLSWSDETIAEYLGQDGLEVWLLVWRGAPAGYAELHRREGGGEVELVYFGLMRHAIGQGIGGPFLSEAIGRAWNAETRRVWLHTCTLDHPNALANYRARGFRVVREEHYTARVAVAK